MILINSDIVKFKGYTSVVIQIDRHNGLDRNEICCKLFNEFLGSNIRIHV